MCSSVRSDCAVAFQLICILSVVYAAALSMLNHVSYILQSAVKSSITIMHYNHIRAQSEAASQSLFWQHIRISATS